MFAVGLLYKAFIMLRYIPSMHAFCGFFFYHKWVLNSVKDFICIDSDNHIAFNFKFANVVYHVDWFANIEESLHLWHKAHLVMICDHCNMLLDSVC